jgi:hypothetical protein
VVIQLEEGSWIALLFPCRSPADCFRQVCGTFPYRIRELFARYFLFGAGQELCQSLNQIEDRFLSKPA